MQRRKSGLGGGRKRRKGLRWRWYRGTEMEQLERLR